MKTKIRCLAILMAVLLCVPVLPSKADEQTELAVSIGDMLKREGTDDVGQTGVLDATVLDESGIIIPSYYHVDREDAVFQSKSGVSTGENGSEKIKEDEKIEEIEEIEEQIQNMLAGNISSGTCGDQGVWSFDESTGELTISGTGVAERTDALNVISQDIISVRIEEGITELGEAIFFEFSNIKKVSLPSTLKKLGKAAFCGCVSLEEIQLKEGLETIESYALERTYALKTVTFPSTLAQVHEYAFFDAGTERFEVAGSNPVYTSKEGVLFSKDEKVLLLYPSGKAEYTYQIPDGVEIIGTFAFGWADVREVLYGKSVKTIEDFAFSYCNVKEMDIPDQVTEVGDCILSESMVERVSLGAGLKEPGYRMCSECANLKEFVFGSNMTTTGKLTFAECYNLQKVTLSDSITEISNGAFGLCYGLEEITLPPNLEVIAYQAFLRCTSLHKIEFPDRLREIWGYAFAGTALSGEIVLPDSMERVEVSAFPEAVKLTTKLMLCDGASYIRAGNITFDAEQSYTDAFEVLRILNKERSDNGLDPLAMDQALLRTAMKRAEEIAVFFSHSRPSGTDLFSMEPKFCGENIALGYGSPQHVMTGWMNSPGHRENILTSDFNCVGIGAIVVQGTTYWVQCFGVGVPEEAKQESYQNGKVKAEVLVANWTDEYYLSAETEKTAIKPGESTQIVVYACCEWYKTRIDPECFDYTSEGAECTISDTGVVTGVSGGTAKVTVSVKSVPSLCASQELKISDAHRGDVDEDGNVNISDLRFLLRAVCNKVELTEAQVKAADFDGNGKAGIEDLRILLRYICGKITEL